MAKGVHKLFPLLLLLLVPVTLGAWTLLGELFRAPRIHETGARPLDVAAADLNHDGHLDALTANRDGRSVSVFLGDGSGRLEPAGTLPTRLREADRRASRAGALASRRA